MKRDKTSGTRYVSALAGLAVLLFLLAVLNLCLGSSAISLREIGHLLRGSGESTAYDIVYNIRLPRILAGILLGGALSISGYLLQIFFANPIAGPYVLGISSGAKLTVALAMVFLLGKGITLSALGMTLTAFLGSLLVMGFVLLLSGKIKNMSLLVVAGVMVGYICSAEIGRAHV